MPADSASRSPLLPRIGAPLQRLWRRALALLSLAFLLAAPAPSSALELGPLQALSRLGQPLRASVELLGSTGQPLDGCFRLEPGPGSPSPRSAAFRLERKGDQLRLLIQSDEIAVSPIVKFTLISDCESRNRRDYAALLDPADDASADIDPSARAPGARPIPIDTSLAASPLEAHLPAPPSRSAASGEPARDAKALPARPRAPLSRPARLLSVSGERALSLRLDMSLPGAARSPSPGSADASPRPGEPALGQKISELSSQIADLQRGLEALRSSPGAMAPAQRPDSPSSSPLALLLAALASGALVFAAFFLAPRSARIRSAAARWRLLDEWISLWRTRDSAESPRPATPPAPPAPGIPLRRPIAPPLPEKPWDSSSEEAWRDGAARISSSEAPSDFCRSAPLLSARETDGDPDGSPTLPDLHSPWTHSSPEPKNAILDLAEVCIAHGNSDLAICILEEHLRLDPSRSPVPWMLLLDLLHLKGDRDAYARASLETRSLFNIDIRPPLLAESDEGSVRHLEDYPHILHEMTRLWGTSDIESFFGELIFDRRGGTRCGFDPAAYREIILLRSIALSSDPECLAEWRMIDFPPRDLRATAASAAPLLPEEPSDDPSSRHFRIAAAQRSQDLDLPDFPTLPDLPDLPYSP